MRYFTPTYNFEKQAALPKNEFMANIIIKGKGAFNKIKDYLTNKLAPILNKIQPKNSLKQDLANAEKTIKNLKYGIAGAGLAGLGGGYLIGRNLERNKNNNNIYYIE